MPFALIERFATFSKTKSGALAGNWMPDEILVKHPFPGPGLAVRVLGEVTADHLMLLREADAVVRGGDSATPVSTKRLGRLSPFCSRSQCRSYGRRTDYGLTVAVRVVNSDDAMTADWTRLPGEVLERISTRIVNEVAGITRVVYDITSKPPGHH